MRPIEQVAIKTGNIVTRIKDVGPLYPFNGIGHASLRAQDLRWVTDRVHALHVYAHPDYRYLRVGRGFEVLLAFNYNILPGIELELIQLVGGNTVQLMQGELGEGLSHFGYHIRNEDHLLRELDWWNTLGHSVIQVSVTTDHEGTSRRYLYAFVDTVAKLGVYTKVIYRIPEGQSRGIDELVEEYSRVNRAIVR